MAYALHIDEWNTNNEVIGSADFILDLEKQIFTRQSNTIENKHGAHMCVIRCDDLDKGTRTMEHWYFCNGLPGEIISSFVVDFPASFYYMEPLAMHFGAEPKEENTYAILRRPRTRAATRTHLRKELPLLDVIHDSMELMFKNIFEVPDEAVVKAIKMPYYIEL